MAVSSLSPLVEVIILNWNLPDDTGTCVESVLLSDYPNRRITVVDNGSTDGSPELLEARFGNEICLKVNDENLGFGEGNNRGIEAALDKGADYTLLLNNDTTIAPSMISELVTVMQDQPQIGILGPMIYYADSTDTVWFSGMRFIGKLYVVQKGLHLRSPLRPVEEVEFVSGCGMFVRRSVWETIGLFAPEFFMYYEDLDLCLRAAQAGFGLATATGAKMWHRVSSSTGGAESPMKQYHQVKSSLIFYRKHTQGLWFVANLGLRVGHAGWVTVKQLIKGKLRWEAARWYFRGVWEIIRGRECGKSQIVN